MSRATYATQSIGIATTQRAKRAVLDGGYGHRASPFARDRRLVTSLLFGRGNRRKFQRPWHDPTFMQDSAPAEVEKWLLSLMQSTRKNAEERGIKCSDSSSRDPVLFFDKDFALDATAYLRVLEAYARSNMADSPQKAEYWVGVLERHHAAATELFFATFGGRRINAGPPIETGFASLKAKSPTSNAGNARRAEKQTFDNTRRDDAAAIVRGLQPNVECYNAIIESWARDKNPISVVRARRWLSKLENEAKDVDRPPLVRSPLGPNARSFDLYLDSCSRGLGRQNKLRVERAEECERILEYRLSPQAPLGIRPTTQSFNYVLRAWTRCRKEMSVAGRVMDLVLRMERIQKEHLLAEENGTVDEDEIWKGNIAPDTKSYSMALDGWIIKAGLKAQKWRSKQLAINNSSKQRWRGVSNEQPHGDDDINDDGTKEMEKAGTILK